MPGRRTKLTPDVAGKILAALRTGAFQHVAAASAGIAEATLREWLARGEGRHASQQANRRFAAFAAEVRQAQAEARYGAEHEVWKTNPLAWLRHGPGRERPGEPGWTDGSKREIADEDGGRVRHEIVFVNRPGEPP